MDDAIRETEKYVNKYNNERLNGAIGYIAPVDKLEGRGQMIFDERKRKLVEAQQQRKAQHAAQKCEGNAKSLDISDGFEESHATG